jgi:phage-related protein
MKQLRWADLSIEEWMISNCKKGVRKAVARELRRLQKGEKPLAYRVLNGFGSQVGELKRGQIRVAYTTELAEIVGIAAAFRKDSKSGDAMRPEHARQIERGLKLLRGNHSFASDKLSQSIH